MLEKLTSTARVVLAFKRRMIKKLKRRSPSERLKARLYYRKNKTKLKLRRNRYLKKNKIFNRSKKLFKRTTPSWLKKTKYKTPTLHKAPKPLKLKKPTVLKPSKPKIKKLKFNVPKRNK